MASSYASEISDAAGGLVTVQLYFTGVKRTYSAAFLCTS